MNLATTAGGSERPSESSPVMQFTTIKELFEEIEKVEKAGGDILTVKGTPVYPRSLNSYIAPVISPD